MTKITLVRHGETDYNKNGLIQGRIDIPLNQFGKKQALLTAKHFINQEIDTIISSPLSRATETASIIAREINYQGEIIFDQAFVERDFGPVDGKDYLPIVNQLFADKITGMEKNEQLIKRIMTGLNNVVAKYHRQSIMIVCHSHSIKAILNSTDPEKYDFSYPLQNCGVTLLEYNQNQYKIIKASYNDYL
jgi:broad specificity phosphatase PhoE